MVTGAGAAESKARGYKAALHNPRNSDEAKAHAQNELNQLSDTPERNEDQRHEGNVKRGLKAAVHNPNNTDHGRQDARSRLESMGEEVGEPSD